MPDVVVGAPDVGKRDAAPRKEADDLRQLKVRLPVHLHLRLIQAKIEQGQTISDLVNKALEEFFRKRDP